MSVLNNSNAISTGGADYNLESSLRFRSSANAYLSRTFGTPTNNKKWTISFWLKLSEVSAIRTPFGAAGSPTLIVSFDANRNFLFKIGGINYYISTPVYRDPSAWAHFIFVYDSDNATQADRTILYVNGTRQAATTASLPSGQATSFNANGVVGTLGAYLGNFYEDARDYFDGYMTEVNFVDGQALTPSDFGETDTTTGVWKPKQYTGTYGTNGFYLPFKETQQATGFNTVLWSGNGTSQSITGVGFSPDFVWYKRRDAAGNNNLYDTVRGATKYLTSNFTIAEVSGVLGVSSFDSDGFTIGNSVDGNASGGSYVGWCWDAGSSTVSNTDGTITSSVRANPASGFSVVTYVGNTTAGATVGHGLGTAPKMIITKNRDTSTNWWVYHESIGNTKYLELNTTIAETTNTGAWNNTSPDSNVFTLGSTSPSNANQVVAYCFSEIAGFSKFGSYTGNGSASGPTVTTGFRPAFVMVKRTDSADEWAMHDNTRDPDNKVNLRLRADSSGAELTTQNIDFNDNGFQVTSTSASHNASGGNYIYMAFADTRDAQFNFDASGNKNNWTANNINSNASSETTYDIMNDVATLTDEDTGNFAVLNPLDTLSGTITNGNLSFTSPSTGYGGTRCTIATPSSGKWYWETTISSITGGFIVGISSANEVRPVVAGESSTSYGYQNDGYKRNNLTPTAYGASYTTNDVIGVALNLDDGTLVFYKNNTSQGTAFSSLSGSFLPMVSDLSNSTSSSASINFGQRPFAYTPPTGFKKLNTYNLPDSTIVDGSQYMNPVTYTGTGAIQSITGVGFSPDLVWLKSRSSGTDNHYVTDSVRGVQKPIYTNLTLAEGSDANGLTSFNSDGFTIGTQNQINTNTDSYVSWNWRGSDSSAVSNTDGTITSTVSANTTSGFSVVTYTGNATSGATIGHGLGVAPKMVIIKNRTTTSAWRVGHNSLPSWEYILNLSDTGNTGPISSIFNSTAPNSSVVTLGNNTSSNASGNNFVAYCFAEVEGFSKFGSYTGNGSTDGPFVYTGFRPAFVLVKRTDGVQNWTMYDSARDTDNVVQNLLVPNTSGAEATYAIYDFLSNGFKLRNTDTAFNGSGANYIYMAFAENPFKQSLAR